MKLDVRQTRMLHVLGASWLPMPEKDVPQRVARVQAPPTQAPTQPSAPAVPTAAVRSASKPAPHPPPPRQAPVDAGNADWQSLNAQIAACTACGLCQGRRNAVLGAGSLQAPLMVLGAAPSDDDDAAGQAFMGQAGQLLDNMLLAINAGREPVADASFTPAYITNTAKCRPPGKRKASPDELAACSGFLQRQVQLLKPRVLLALGDEAARQLLHSNEPLDKLRGKVHAVAVGGVGLQVIVTHDPSFLLRSPAYKAQVWQDLCLLADTLETPSP